MRDGFIKVAAATPEIRVADCGFNAASICDTIETAAALGVKLLALPELCITGYTCGDLFFQKLLSGAVRALKTVCEAHRPDMIVIAGLPVVYGGKLFNCAAVLYKGRCSALCRRRTCRTTRVLRKGSLSRRPVKIRISFLRDLVRAVWGKAAFSCRELESFKFAVEICEDLWVISPPSVSHARAGASIIVNISASNEVVGKAAYRRDLINGQSARLVCGYVYSDAGEDESTTDLVFAAHNIIAENGIILAESPRFERGIAVSEIDTERLVSERKKLTTFPLCGDSSYMDIQFSMPLEQTELTRFFSPAPFIPEQETERAKTCEEILKIQSFGLKKRLVHSGANAAVLAISGGLDSALALLVAVRAADILKRPRTDVLAVTMPCFGTTERTLRNAERLCKSLGVAFRTIDITKTVRQHFADIGHDEKIQNAAYENAQARERTQVLMDIANEIGGLVVGTGDLSELALGWTTYNGDHMSMYGVNCSIPKTLVRHLVAYEADRIGGETGAVLADILATPVSPELLPPSMGEISQKTEDIVGPYELHDFFLYYAIRWTFPPAKVFRLAKCAFAGAYDDATILKWPAAFYTLFAQQFKRSCSPDGPKVGSVSPFAARRPAHAV